MTNEPDEKGLEGDVTLQGSVPKLGEFKIDITAGPQTNRPPMSGSKKCWNEKPLDRTLYHSAQVPEAEVWKAKGEYPCPPLREQTIANLANE